VKGKSLGFFDVRMLAEENVTLGVKKTTVLGKSAFFQVANKIILD